MYKSEITTYIGIAHSSVLSSFHLIPWEDLPLLVFLLWCKTIELPKYLDSFLKKINKKRHPLRKQHWNIYIILATIVYKVYMKTFEHFIQNNNTLSSTASLHPSYLSLKWHTTAVNALLLIQHYLPIFLLLFI